MNAARLTAGDQAEHQRDHGQARLGPKVADIRRMLGATSADTEVQNTRLHDCLTFYCLGLRVSELCSLDLDETDLGRGTTWIKGKGRREKEMLPLPAPVVEVITRYLVTSTIVASDKVSMTGHTAVRRCLTRDDPRSNARRPTMKTLLIIWEGAFTQSGGLL